MKIDILWLIDLCLYHITYRHSYSPFNTFMCGEKKLYAAQREIYILIISILLVLIIYVYSRLATEVFQNPLLVLTSCSVMLYSFLNCDLMRVLFVNAMKTELTGSKNQLQLHTSFIVFRWLWQVLPQLRALQFSQGLLHFPLSPCSGVPSLQLLTFPEEVISQALLMFFLHVHSPVQTFL